MKKLSAICGMVAFGTVLVLAQGVSAPKPIGRMIDIGGHKMHMNCIGKGSPTVVVENGFDEYSFDWVLVQQRVEKFARMCTYDRPGYAWSQPGPKPRTYAQLNLELHDLLRKAGERGPFVLVGHSFGGPVARNYAMTYPRDVAGLVLVDTVAEKQRIVIGKHAVRLDASAKGLAVPKPRPQIEDSDKPRIDSQQQSPAATVEPPYDRLPKATQELHLWADPLPYRDDAASSERQWSPEYLSKWVTHPESARLGDLPLVVLSREHGGYADDLEVSGKKLEEERRQLQMELAKLSTIGKHRFVNSGHDMHIEAPDEVTSAIREVVESARHKK